MDGNFKITQRHLPHWTLEGSIYFITFCAYQTTFNQDEQKIILEHIVKGDGVFYDCFAAMVMPDHVHLLIRPKFEFTLSRIMKGTKGVSAYLINKHRNTKGKVWQDESFDRIVRDEKEFWDKFDYMLYNPVKRNLTEDPWHYVGWYCNEKYWGIP